jgi:hypothetical protein
MTLRTMQHHDTFETSIRFDATWAKLENAMYEEIIRRMVDDFLAKHSEEIRSAIDVNAVISRTTDAVAAKIEEIFRREFGGDKSIDDRAREMRIMNDLCPECNENWKNNKDVNGKQPLGPEWMETLRERGINPYTGHRRGCSLQGGV